MSGPRIVLCGGPHVGKTTTADAIASAWGIAARHTDDLIGRCDWSGASLVASQWLSEPGPWVVEGTAAVRALRKAMRASNGQPCDVACFLTEPKERQTDGQKSMAKACLTIWTEILPELKRRGVDTFVGTISSLNLARKS